MSKEHNKPEEETFYFTVTVIVQEVPSKGPNMEKAKRWLEDGVKHQVVDNYPLVEGLYPNIKLTLEEESE